MDSLVRYRVMLDYINKHVTGAEVGNSNKIVAGASLYNVALDHAQGIYTLFNEQNYTSAFALIRSQFESLIRAAWLLYCANEKQLDIFIKKDRIQNEVGDSLYFSDMLKSVEKALDWPDTLSNIQTKIWGGLNGYTHGGLNQVVGNYNGKFIGSNYSIEEVEEGIKFSAMLAFLTFCRVVYLASNKNENKLADLLLEQNKDWCFAS